MATVVGICNRALQLLGASRIVALDQDSKSARACNTAYDPCLRAELRKHSWNCAISRASLAEDATAPDWGRQRSFQLPTNFIRLLRPYPEDQSYDLDSIIEGRKILTNASAPLYVRYIYLITDPNEMDALFCEALSHRMAIAMCEELTQSNTKRAQITVDYKDVIGEARRANAFEKVAGDPPMDTWESCRA